MLVYNHIAVFILLIVFSIDCCNVNGQSEIIENGYNIIYHKDGKISSEGFMRNGKPDGYWKTYYTNGVLKSEGNRKNFLLDSTWLFFNIYGDTLEKINFLYGKKNGYSYTYNTDRNDKYDNLGNILSKELYVNDKKEGIAYYYFNDGNIYRLCNYTDNRLNGYTYEYDRKNNIVAIIRYSKGILVDREKINSYNNNSEKEGVWKEFYENLSIKSESNYINGMLSGLYKEFDENGKILLKLKYENNYLIEDDDFEQDSVSIKNEYDTDGKIVFSGTYKYEIPVGIHRYFNKEGIVIKSYIYNENGIKISEGIVNRDGSKEGKWKYLYENGSIRSEGSYVNNRENGGWKYYYLDGRIEQNGEYKNGLYNGKWTWYFENGKVRKEENYFNGKEEGEAIEYDSNDNIIVKGEFIDGEREGMWLYLVNEHKEVGSYVTGLRDGRWKYFYDNDQLKFDGNYIQGNPDGKHKYYYDNGLLKEEQFYSQGIKEKNWKKYDREGNLIITITYEKDKEIRINGEKINIADNEMRIL